MTTVTKPITKTSFQLGHKKCPGCLRCQDSNAAWCKTYHARFKGLHPVCKACGHCVLRGTHLDDAKDVKGDKQP